MNEKAFRHWRSALDGDATKPAYLLIADLIAADIDSGRMQVRDRLPPLRDISQFLGLNYTTLARAYSEAKQRGLIDSRRGTGSFVKGKTTSLRLNSGSDFEMTMNLPPEPESKALLQRIVDGTQNVLTQANLNALFRYQDFGGGPKDRDAGVQLLAPLLDNLDANQMLVCPGIHSVLVALLTQLHAERGGCICVPDLVYPGLKAIASQIGVPLLAVASEDGIPQIRPLEEMCKTEQLTAIYVNPTVNNPTTKSMSPKRREAIADIALRYNVPIIEDDAYGLLLEKPIAAIANLAPELTYYTTGLAKCFGAGLRTAYLYAPTRLLAQRTAGAFRALSVMASPVTTALATRWIEDGTLQEMTHAIRAESRERQRLALQHLADFRLQTHPDAFHLWLHLPGGYTANPSVLAAHFRTKGISVVSSAGFCTNNDPPDAIRLCLGGAVSRSELEESLRLLSDTLQHPSHLSGMVL
ncbi:MAG: PLP-dependent aminotransferase family protein [Pseudomonadota bacterium]